MSIRNFLCLPVLICIMATAVQAQNAPHIAILGALPPLTDERDAENAAATLKRDGFAPEILTPAQIADPMYFTPSRFAALVAPHCRLFPAIAQPNLLTYLRGQGKLLCIGGPAFERYAYREGTEWKTRNQLTKPLSAALAGITPPDLPTLSPPDQVVHIGSEIAGAWLPIARERGIGFAGLRSGRLLPSDPRGAEIGYSPEIKLRQWGYLSLSGPMRGAIWGLNPRADAPNEPTFTPLSAILKRILQGVYLVKGGAELPTYPVGSSVIIGTELVNFGQGRKVAAEIEIHGGSEQEYQKVISRPAETLTKGAESGYSESLMNLPYGDYTVRITLFEETGAAEDERPVLDRLTASFRVLPPPDLKIKPPVQIEKGEFVRDGKPFLPHILNFAPSWTIEQNAAAKRQGWLSPEQYDPELVQRDLKAAANQGANIVRIAYARIEEFPALLDFLQQCRNLNLLADVVVHEANPPAWQDLVRDAHFTHHPALFGVEIVPAPVSMSLVKVLGRVKAQGMLSGLDETKGSVNSRIVLHPTSASSSMDFTATLAIQKHTKK